MARRVFFSFHFERDIWRASQVRNSWIAKPDRESAGFWDAATWEKVKKDGDDAIKRWINTNLVGTSVTVVLIGADTSTRKWVRYEVQRSYDRGNGMPGVYIHNIKDQNKEKDSAGNAYFGELGKDANGKPVYFGQLYPTCDWVNDDGYSKFGAWVEKAARIAGK